jgi:hypothetical protein
MPQQFQKYNISVAIITQSGFVAVMDNCNSWMVTNTGADTVEVNGMTLFPGTFGTILGDSKTIGGNQGEVYTGNIKVSFLTLVNPRLEVVQKSFVI